MVGRYESWYTQMPGYLGVLVLFSSSSETLTTAPSSMKREIFLHTAEASTLSSHLSIMRWSRLRKLWVLRGRALVHSVMVLMLLTPRRLRRMASLA